jgi:hypothetical protein
VRLFKELEAFLNHFQINGGFFINVGRFERLQGFLNTFSWKWRLLFRNVRLLKDIFREVKAFLD